MSDVIDLAAKRAEREEQPDPEHVCQDQHGRPMYRFAADYEFGDANFSVDLWAYDHDDAAARIEAMKASLKCVGQIYMEVR